ncbi:MAG: TonB family protein [Deltaproteobacteria bacterium]|nr:TonB family protein [Deltaproteobacteria bacterium]
MSLVLHIALAIGLVMLERSHSKIHNAPVEIDFVAATTDVGNHKEITAPQNNSHPPLSSMPRAAQTHKESSTSQNHSPAVRQTTRQKRHSRQNASRSPASTIMPELSEPEKPAQKVEAEAVSSEPVKIQTKMTFSDFETLMGQQAVDSRKEYNDSLQKKRQTRHSHARHSNQLKAAIGQHRSALVGAEVIPVGAKAALVTQYLKTLHRTLVSKFGTFLDSLDSPSERMHKKVQNSPLKYNPFYVPPPDAERQFSMQGPMNDLSIHAVTEFEILPSGELGDLRLVRSSRHTVFDSAALDTVIKSAPFAPPPKSLLSKNNRSYVQWTFQRDWKKNTWGQGHLYLLSPLSNSDSVTEVDVQ